MTNTTEIITNISFIVYFMIKHDHLTRITMAWQARQTAMCQSYQQVTQLQAVSLQTPLNVWNYVKKWWIKWTNPSFLWPDLNSPSTYPFHLVELFVDLLHLLCVSVSEVLHLSFPGLHLFIQGAFQGHHLLFPLCPQLLHCRRRVQGSLQLYLEGLQLLQAHHSVTTASTSQCHYCKHTTVSLLQAHHSVTAASTSQCHYCKHITVSLLQTHQCHYCKHITVSLLQAHHSVTTANTPVSLLQAYHSVTTASTSQCHYCKHITVSLL